MIILHFQPPVLLKNTNDFYKRGSEDNLTKKSKKKKNEAKNV